MNILANRNITYAEVQRLQRVLLHLPGKLERLAGVKLCQVTSLLLFLWYFDHSQEFHGNGERFWLIESLAPVEPSTRFWDNLSEVDLSFLIRKGCRNHFQTVDAGRRFAFIVLVISSWCVTTSARLRQLKVPTVVVEDEGWIFLRVIPWPMAVCLSSAISMAVYSLVRSHELGVPWKYANWRQYYSNAGLLSSFWTRHDNWHFLRAIYVPEIVQQSEAFLRGKLTWDLVIVIHEPWM